MFCRKVSRATCVSLYVPCMSVPTYMKLRSWMSTRVLVPCSSCAGPRRLCEEHCIVSAASRRPGPGVLPESSR